MLAGKPLCRWCIGPVDPLGFTVLQYSISKFTSLYQDTFDYLLCYSQIHPSQISRITIPKLLIKQIDLPKIFTPPRLRIDQPELFLSNEVVIHQKAFDDFLNNNNVIQTQESNTVIGLPAHFDFEARLRHYQSFFRDEQLLIHHCLETYPNKKILTEQEISIDSNQLGSVGNYIFHANRGNEFDWNNYKQLSHFIS